MPKLTAPAVPINPYKVLSFIDTIQIWLEAPLSAAERAFLKKHGDLLKPENRRPDWNMRFCQRNLIHQPDLEAVLFFKKRKSFVFINRVDVSLDWLFRDEAELAFAESVFNRTFFKSYHRHPYVHYELGTRYTDKRWKNANIVSSYADKACRITGEPFCLHLDWSITGHQALQRVGLCNIDDIIGLDCQEFWEPRLRFKEMNAEQLYRLVCKRHFRSDIYHSLKARQKKSRFPYDPDAKFEAFMERAFAGGLHQCWRTFASPFRLERCFPKLDGSHLLPDSALSFL